MVVFGTLLVVEVAMGNGLREQGNVVAARNKVFLGVAEVEVVRFLMDDVGIGVEVVVVHEGIHHVQLEVYQVVVAVAAAVVVSCEPHFPAYFQMALEYCHLLQILEFLG